MDKKKYTAIILSAGTGSRMKSNMPKQYMELLGQPVIYYSIKAFEDSPVDEIVIVCSADYIEYFRHSIIEKYGFKKVKAIVQGGKERYNSVYEGLKAANGTDYVLIHDGARPLVDNEIIVRSMHTVEKEKSMRSRNACKGHNKRCQMNWDIQQILLTGKACGRFRHRNALNMICWLSPMISCLVTCHMGKVCRQLRMMQ